VARLREALIDFCVVVILVGFGAAFVLARHDQTRYDSEARAIATWARDQGVSRIAWPEDRRASVPTLLGEGITPVLVDDGDVVAQHLALNRSSVVVTGNGSPSVPIVDSFRADELVAHLVDLSRASSIPLTGRDSAGEQISRPYVYSPLQDSRRIERGAPFRAHLLLTPGRYLLTVEAFDPERASRLRITAATGGRSLADITRPAMPIVMEPTSVSFRVPGTDAAPVRLSLMTVGGTDAAVLMHGWSIERVGRTG
jgi:hypothetical protein